MRRRLRGFARIAGAALPLSLVACYAHYSWIALEAVPTSTASTEGGAAAFSQPEVAEAVEIAAEVARSLGLEVSEMDQLPPPEPTTEDPFRRLALFRGSGEYENLQLSVAIRDDRSILRCWISDPEHPGETEVVRALVKGLEEQLERAFPERRIRVGDGRKLRWFGG